jgi:hypothetical protein
MVRRVEIDIIADSTGKGFKDTAADAELAAKGVDHLGDQMGQTERQAGQLNRKIVEQTVLVKALGAAYVETGSKDVFKNLRTERGELNKLQTIRKEMGNIGQAAEQLTAEAGRFGPAIEKAFSNLPFLPASPQIALPIVAAIVGSAPAIGAALSGAILAGLGTGVIAAGIVAQFTNSRVHDAGTAFVTDLKNQIVSASSGFADPLIAGLGFLKRDLEPVFADLRKDFESLRPYVSAFLDHLGQMVQHVMPGLNRAIEKSGPVIEELGKDLVILGDGVSTFFDELSKGSKGGVEGLRAIAVFLATTIAGIGFLLRGLSNIADFGIQAMDKIEQGAKRVGGVLAVLSPLAGALLGTFADQTHSLATSFDSAGLSADDFTTSLDRQGGALAQTHGIADVFDSTVNGISTRTQALTASIQADITALGTWSNMFQAINGTAISVEQSQEAMTNSLAALTDGVKTNGNSLDVNTTKGAANRASVLASIQTASQAAQAAYDNAVANGRQSTATQESTAVYNAYITKLVAAATAAGFNKDQIWSMINALGALPKEVVTRVRTIFLAEGTQPPGYRPGVHIAMAQGGLRRAAVGMLIPPSNPGTILAGEPQTGGEWLIPRMGLGQGRAQSLLQSAGSTYGIDAVPRYGGARMSTASRWGGGGRLAVTVNVTSAGAAGSSDQALERWFHEGLQTGRIQIYANQVR